MEKRGTLSGPFLVPAEAAVSGRIGLTGAWMLLENHRGSVPDSLLVWWRKQPKPVPRRRVERQRDGYAGEGAPLSRYCQVAAWQLNRKLAGKR